MVAVALAGAAAVGSWAAQVTWFGVAVVSAVAVAAVWLCNALAVIAGCWAMDNKTSGPLLGTDGAVAYRAQLHRLATALRQGATPSEIREAPDFVAADVTALSEAARQDAG